MWTIKQKVSGVFLVVYYMFETQLQMLNNWESGLLIFERYGSQILVLIKLKFYIDIS